LTYASAGVASSSHVLGAFFNMAAGIDTTHVPYKGGAPGMLDLRAGRVSYMVTSLVSALNFVRDGRARVLASTGAKRSHLLPDVPTVAESGFPGFETTLWHGVLAPAKVPREVVLRLNREVVKVLAMPGVQKLLQAEGGVVSPSTPEEFEAFLRAEVAKWTKVIKQTGITLD
jgi:tripartite-type tricarboxylate transporter receptor subunit TctC